MIIEPKTALQLETQFIIKSLRRDSSNERGACLVQLIYTVLNSGAHTPLALTVELDIQPSKTQQCNALRALMFRIQLMLCCRESETQSSAGWKTLSSVFKYAVVTKNDTKLIAALTSQPWTHTLISFQLTQDITLEFLTFTQNWLTLLKITMQRTQHENKRYFSKDSLLVKTMSSLNKNVVVKDNDDMAEVKQKILTMVKQILE
ncbi:unnamed protein product [Diatraea saccharalis]|uniref:Uncharacterized protein n=1 Tax=Diatraea saccharalis TaxID=40085 RepID=A0A9N9REW1_9NEOP|nr:unnamed protein product [Diatraea saccharalis]